ncbi:sensor domain-containing protein [Aureimonas psammosilenae]|uniref:sensor domain-containing protein n=1 Tax=Aureimonas psammosilenae TaxID=2495496 RepID=UPI001260B55D|nr:sensor domain-containing protein [Aureimonas psammosilenae]
MRVLFLYLAQIHQIPHTLPIAMEMARTGEAEVHLASASDDHLRYMKELGGLYPDAAVTYRRLFLPPPLRTLSRLRHATTLPKVPALLFNLAYLRSFDAIVVPERTSLLLKKLGLGRTRLVWTGHGGGDRAHGYTENVGRFDFVLLPGEKLVRRHRQAGNLSEGHYGVGGYAKFDLVERMAERRAPLFANDRPTVVYNPHFRPGLSSWPEMGWQVLDFFAQSRDYNLVFAPHMRLFDPPTPEKYAPFRRFADLPHMRIDLGSTASVDMTYTGQADLYLGDVSSQIAEFTIRPRPLVFLNPRRTPWAGDPNYRSWELGPVVEDIADLGAALGEALATQDEMRERRAAYFADTFDLGHAGPSAPRGARAILDYLKGPA